ncbi:hypothetical protein CRG98_012055 [Punica granatum]|uniref:Uncharacterized protein n=1 Tax=Punica granatum TaxID=22663 RepID=A0A2I0KG44_PUNGR|nr:hypothetical protein CRG98_012055 [Punica granatum]
MATPSHVRPSRIPGKVDTPEPRCIGFAHAFPDEIKFGCVQYVSVFPRKAPGSSLSKSCLSLISFPSLMFLSLTTMLFDSGELIRLKELAVRKTFFLLYNNLYNSHLNENLYSNQCRNFFHELSYGVSMSAIAWVLGKTVTQIAEVSPSGSA